MGINEVEKLASLLIGCPLQVVSVMEESSSIPRLYKVDLSMLPGANTRLGRFWKQYQNAPASGTPEVALLNFAEKWAESSYSSIQYRPLKYTAQRETR